MGAMGRWLCATFVSFALGQHRGVYRIGNSRYLFAPPAGVRAIAGFDYDFRCDSHLVKIGPRQ